MTNNIWKALFLLRNDLGLPHFCPFAKKNIVGLGVHGSIHFSWIIFGPIFLWVWSYQKTLACLCFDCKLWSTPTCSSWQVCLGNFVGRQFKLRMLQERRKDDARWKLLVRKVVSAKAISSLSQQKRKRGEEVRDAMGAQSFRNFTL